MIEALVGLSLVTVGLLGILHFISDSIALNREAHNRFVATYLAAEGIEIVKNVVDSHTAGEQYDLNYEIVSGNYQVSYTDLEDFGFLRVPVIGSTEYITLDPGTGVYGYGSGIDTPFLRTVKVTSSASTLEVLSEVKWESDDEEYMVELEDTFRSWRR